MTNTIVIKKITPTVFLSKNSGALKQLVKLVILCKNKQADCFAVVKTNGNHTEIPLGTIMEGESVHEIFIDEIKEAADIEFILKYGDIVADVKVISWIPPKHWTVHVVQASHHDPGYSDLPSTVLLEHDSWLNQAIDYAEETGNFPDDARFRIVIEQAWSIDHFIKNAPADRVAKIIELMRSGQFELTALFGNMTTELCGHETLIRSLYHANRLKRKYGIPIMSAEHNDITGISWGVSRLLSDAGIKIFCPGLPLYYIWGKQDLQSFWDEKAIFPHGGPGAFWWEAPTGKRLLLWCNNSGCGGDRRGSMPALAPRLQELDESNYPYSVMRWPVGGAFRDNAPYIRDYADTIRDWNEKWAYPHLVSSTNAKFYTDFVKQLPSDLPVFHGELAGQDYPIGATSTAEATAANRNNHAGLLTAEKFSTAAEILTDYKYQKDLLFNTHEEVLWHDEHAWGYHFPCGPAMKASEYEKALHAHRASAFVNEITRKSIARIADYIKTEDDGFRLVVFNSTHSPKTGPVCASLREIDNCGSTIAKVSPQDDPEGVGYLRGYILTDRWPAHPPSELQEGRFELVEYETGEQIPFQIISIESHMDTVPYAAQRAGLGSGGRRYGFFEIPSGLKRDLCFIARGVPAYGYKTYKLIRKDTKPVFTNSLKTSGYGIENEYYRISIEPDKGIITSIYDKLSGRELIDTACPHCFNELIVRIPETEGEFHSYCAVAVKLNGPVCSSIEFTGSIYGHPSVTSTIKLFAGIRQIYVETKILKDSTPLLDVHLAFPFRAENPLFRYEGSLSVMNPIKDYLPGSYSDTIAVQNWVKITDGSYNIMWSSLDAPIAGFSGLWPGYISPAHRCVFGENAKHPPLRSENLNKGWIYSNVFNNNFGTNFATSQVGEVLFRYVISTCEGEVSDSYASVFGWQAVTQFEQIFTNKHGKGSLPASDSFMNTNNENVVLLNCKKAEDDDGYIVRLWNMTNKTESVKVRLNYMKIRGASLADLTEEDSGIRIAYDDQGFSLIMEKSAVATIRIRI